MTTELTMVNPTRTGYKAISPIHRRKSKVRFRFSRIDLKARRPDLLAETKTSRLSSNPIEKGQEKQQGRHHCIKSRPQTNGFLLKITDNPPTSLSEMLERAYKKRDSEETMDQIMKEVTSWGAQRPAKQNNFNRNNTRSVARRPSQGEIFKDLKNKGVLLPPPPMDERTQQFRNNGRYCEYHQDHTTDKCRTLAWEIEKHQAQVNLAEPQGHNFHDYGRRGQQKKNTRGEQQSKEGQNNGHLFFGRRQLRNQLCIVMIKIIC